MKHKAQPKIKFTIFVASSIDGRIGADHKTKSNSWTSKEDWKFFQGSLEKMDAVIVGHNTYRISKSRLDKRNTIVFTSKVTVPRVVGSVIFFNPERSSITQFLNNKKYKKVAVLGGPKVYEYFLEKKLLTDMWVTIEPYVFGAGVDMFTAKKFQKYSFILKSVKKLNKKGTILLHYTYAN